MKVVSMAMLMHDDVQGYNLGGKLSLEKELMFKFDHPFVVQMYHAYMTSQNIYFIMPLMKAGDFMGLLK